MTTDEQKVEHDAGSGSPPPEASGDSPRMFTEDQVTAKLRGQGKALAELQAKLAEYEQRDAEAEKKRMEAEGQHKELAERASRDAERAKADAERYRALVEQSVEQRLKALPKELRGELPEDVDIDAKLLLLPALEKAAALVAKAAPVSVNGGPGRSGAKVDRVEESTKKLHAKWGAR